ncbi:hypothetical protein P3T76_010656 [Phytophthora citrophthora]|uniref:RxLR effector protein n=1 Tax=Phytophthora citrophthora TaxID=4793 RepID=A0AAD9GBQ1_9STRA|nr:hypothetical protein P3T76_010656 [Phytophthora citrophthora]
MSSIYRVFLLAVFTLLCGFSNAADSRGRLLRVVDSTEERGGGFPSYLKESFMRWRIDSKIKSWVRKQRTDEYVLSRLGLSALTGKELVNAPKYSHFQDFKVGMWLKEEASTTSVFNTLGLNNVADGALTKADGFGTYAKYVMTLGENAHNYDISKWKELFGGGSLELLKIKRQLLTAVKRNQLEINLMLG